VVLLGHGSGGTMGHELVRGMFLRYFKDPELLRLEDAGLLTLDGAEGGGLAMTTDSYVVKPRFFPGGDIGQLAVCGTVNDLAMRGARAMYMSVAFILEEGLRLDELERVVASMSAAAESAGVRVIAGDTKVVEHGSADGLFITTAGIGRVAPRSAISVSGARVGDVVLLSGAIGDHGLTIMTQREGLRFEGALASDCAPLADLVQCMLAVEPAAIHAMRDPTRGGLATSLHEIADGSSVGIEIDEGRLPVHAPVRVASELLGLDPLYVANEGKLVACVAPDRADAVLAAMRAHPLGREAIDLGQVVGQHPGTVALRTILGTHRVLGMLAGEQLPRIC
jgi:hydrogenase expression/formation protein HypE